MNFENIVTHIINTRCSFCGEVGHSINRCNNDMLIEFEIICRRNKCYFDRHEESRNNFKEWLCNEYIENPLIVKSFAIRRCNCRQRSRPDIIVNAIVNYIFGPEVETMSERNNDFYRIAETTEERLNSNILNALSVSEELVRDFVIGEFYYFWTNNNKPVVLKIVLENLNANSKCDCHICYDKLNKYEFAKLNCGHEFCNDCTIKTIKTNKIICPLCRHPIHQITCYTDEIKDKFDNLKI